MSKSEESAKMVNFLKSWPMITGGALVAGALGYTVTDSTESLLTALTFIIGFYLFALGIVYNNIGELQKCKKHCAWLIWMVSIFICLFFWSNNKNRYRFRRYRYKLETALLEPVPLGVLTEDRNKIFEAAVRYQMYHALFGAWKNR